MSSPLLDDEANIWFDQISTSLNACSLETFVPIPDGPIKRGEDSNIICDAIPLIIGCYQLNETSSEGSTAGELFIAPPEDDSGDDVAALKTAAAAGTAHVEKSSRRGELRLYMIPSTSSSSYTSLESDARDKNTFRFTDAACVVNMESGVLDGKWRRRRCNTRRGSTDGRCDNKPIFASACASGKVHLHSLEKTNSPPSWVLSHLASSDEPAPGDEVSLCLSLAWNDFLGVDGGHCPIEQRDQIVSSYSNGTLALHAVSCAELGKTYEDAGDTYDVNRRTDVVCIEETHRWKAHEMFGCPSEAWTCSFLRGDENVVLSGADDVRSLIHLFVVHCVCVNTYDKRVSNSHVDAIHSALSKFGTYAILDERLIESANPNSTRGSPPYPPIRHEIICSPSGATTSSFECTISGKWIVHWRRLPSAEACGGSSGIRPVGTTNNPAAAAGGSCSSRPCTGAAASSTFPHWTLAAPMEMPTTSRCCPYSPHTRVWHMVPIGYASADQSTMRWPVAPSTIARRLYGIHTIERAGIWTDSEPRRGRVRTKKGFTKSISLQTNYNIYSFIRVMCFVRTAMHFSQMWDSL